MESASVHREPVSRELQHGARAVLLHRQHVVCPMDTLHPQAVNQPIAKQQHKQLADALPHACIERKVATYHCGVSETGATRLCDSWPSEGWDWLAYSLPYMRLAGWLPCIDSCWLLGTKSG